MSNFTQWFTGTDTDSALPFPDGIGVLAEHFYLGRLGGETTANSYGFDIKAAKAATKTFGYWDLAGAQYPGAHSDAATWGREQAHAATAAAEVAQFVTGQTIFLDIEPSNGGWTAAPTVDNVQVLEGALAAVVSAGWTPGIYVSADIWAALFGVDYRLKTPFVLWVAGNANQSLAEAIGFWDRLPTLGGQRPMIWQYNSSGSTASPTQDRNLTPYAGWLTGRWKPTPVRVATPPRTPAEQALALLNAAAADIQQAATVLEQAVRSQP